MQDPLAGSGALKGTVDKAAHMAGYCAKADNRPANIRAAAKPRVMPVCACPKHPNGFDKAGFRRRPAAAIRNFSEGADVLERLNADL